MKILVTGASGFAGKNIIEFFIARGHSVVGTYRKHKPTELEAIGCQLVFQDLSQKINVPGTFDAIIHTAACVQPVTECNYLAFKKDNIDGVENLIKFAKKREIKNFIYFSTRNIYGEIRENEIFEDSDIINPDAYGNTKYIGECMLRDAGNNMNVMCLRMPGISGPGAHNTWLVKIVEECLSNNTVMISDFYTKNFAWIFDIAAFIEKLMIQGMHGEKFKYDTINLACAVGANNRDILDMIKERTKSTSTIVIKRSKKGLFVLNSDKAYEMGYKSLTVLEIVDKYLASLGY